MNATVGRVVPFRVGDWLPSDQALLDTWLAAIIRKSLAEQRSLHPVIADFRDLIEGDPQIFMLSKKCSTKFPGNNPTTRTLQEKRKSGTILICSRS